MLLIGKVDRIFDDYDRQLEAQQEGGLRGALAAQVGIGIGKSVDRLAAGPLLANPVDVLEPGIPGDQLSAPPSPGTWVRDHVAEAADGVLEWLEDRGWLGFGDGR